MFNALSGLGAGGQVDGEVQSNASVALYTTFAFFGFISGSILNYIGAPATLAFGGLGYALYSASFLAYNHVQNAGFVIFAGAMLGVCAACLWTAQGTVMMSYPTEGEKGRYIGLFWAIFNMGAVIGSIIPIAQNWKTVGNKPVNDGTYIGFLVLMVTGAVLAFFLVSPEKVVRKDGTRVQKLTHPSAWSEIKGLYETFISDPYIVLLFPLFWASNWFYTYQFNGYNLFLFNTRGRSFSNLWYWLAQIFGAISFGFFLDSQRLSRRNRAIVGWGVLFGIVMVIWGGGYKVIAQWDGQERRRMGADPPETPNIDVKDSKYAGYVILYIFYGFLDAMWQTYAYWLMGALSNDPRKLAYFAGFYKGIQSAGAAVVWRLDAIKTPIPALFGSSWGLCVAGMLFAAPVIWWKITDTKITAEDYVQGVENEKELERASPVATAAEGEEVKA